MSIKIKDSLATIEKKISDALRQKIVDKGYPKKLIKKTDAMYSDLDKEIQSILVNSPEFASLMYDALKLDFGLSDETSAQLPGLMNLLFNINVVFDLGELNNIFKCDINVFVPDEEDENVQAAIRHASYISPKSGELIDWLRWLLFAGDTTINNSYKVSVKEGLGRSHMGIMMKGPSFSFKVRSEFSGVSGNNFVTRAIFRNSETIINTIKKHLNVA